MDNPYIVGDWVRRPHLYGRENLTKALLRDDRRCMYLMGTRRIGKTSVLRDVELRSSAVTLFVNLQSCATGQQAQLDGTQIISRMKRDLERKARKLPKLAQLLGQMQSTNLCEALEQLAVAAEDNEMLVLILWDESEKLLDLDRRELEPLRSILQDSSSLRTVLAATKGLSVLNDRGRDWGTSPFLFGFVTLPISALAPDEAIPLITQHNHPDGPVQVGNNLIDEILKLCGNHPFLIQRLCERLYQNDRSLRSPYEDDLVVDGLLSDFFAVDFAQLSDGEQRILRALGQRAPQTIVQLQRSTKLNDATLSSFIHGLEQLSFIRAVSNGYEPGNVYLNRWLKMLPTNTSKSQVSDRASLEAIDADRQHMQELRAIKQRRLRELELQAASQGNRDVAVLIELQDLKAEVKQISDRLELPL